MKRLVLAFVLMVAMTMTSSAKKPDTVSLNEATAWIKRQMKVTGDPALAIAVVKDGRIILEQGFGLADTKKQTKATEHTLFSLASISKPITATGIMLLDQRGKLEIDRSANGYLGEAKIRAKVGDAADVSVNNLLNHSSGIGLHYQFYYQDDDYAIPSRDDTIRHYGIAVSKPGSGYKYCNLGYGILDYLISRHSGKPYAQFMREDVFEPLAMTNTFVGLPAERIDDAAVKYDRQGKAVEQYGFDHDGASAVYSSAHDLAMFALFNLGRVSKGQTAILDEDALKRLHTPTNPISAGRGYGMGWATDENDSGYKTVSHTGGMPGVATRLTLVPEHGIAVVCLCNTPSSLPHKTVKKLLSVLLEDYKFDPPNVLVQRRTLPPKFQPSKELTGTWRGSIETYEGNRRLFLWIAKDGAARVKLGSQFITLVAHTRFDNEVFTGEFAGDLQTSDTSRVPHLLRLVLRLEEGVLRGAVETLTDESVRWVKGERVSQRGYFGLTHWAELTRASVVGGERSLFDRKSLTGWKVIKENDFKNHGTVAVTNDVIHIGKGQPAAGIKVAGDFPRINYEVAFEARRTEGNDFFCGVTFPIHDNYCSFIVGGWGGGVVGLSNIDTMAAVENDTTRYLEVKDNQWYTIRLRVTEQRVIAWIDGEEFANIEVANHKFDIWWEQEPVRPFGIASWNTSAEVRNIRLLPAVD